MEVTMKTKIDINSWKRKKQFIFFSNFTNPYASVTSVLDVDKIVKISKESKISFYGIMSYVVLKTLNEIEEFKYVLENNDIYKYDKINISFSVLDTSNSINFSRTVEYTNFNRFIELFDIAKKEAESNTKIKYIKDFNKCYITCLPWIRFTSVENPMNYKVIDSVPRICWGKYFIENDKYMIDLSIQFNHAFQDGYHIGLFYNKLQENINLFCYE